MQGSNSIPVLLELWEPDNISYISWGNGFGVMSVAEKIWELLLKERKLQSTENAK